MTKSAEEITEAIYTAYGSETGFLFGIEPKHRAAVKTIVRLTTEKVGNKLSCNGCKYQCSDISKFDCPCRTCHAYSYWTAKQ